MAQDKSLTPLPAVKGGGSVCTPEAVKDFTAVGYFFGRDLQLARHVPVGIIHASWGGTPAEAWTSEAGLRPLPDFADTSEQLKMLIADPVAAQRQYEARLETWFLAHDTGSAEGSSWRDPALDAGRLEDDDVADASGRTRASPTSTASSGSARPSSFRPAPPTAVAELQLGMVDDIDTTWVNGVKVGATFGYNVVRKYPVPVGVLKPGRNVVVVRVLDTGGGGGIWGDQKLQLVFKDKLPPKGCARPLSVPLRAASALPPVVTVGPLALPDRDEAGRSAAAADGCHRGRHDTDGPLQRDDRAALAVRHPRRDLVSGRSQRAGASSNTARCFPRRSPTGGGPGARTSRSSSFRSRLSAK